MSLVTSINSYLHKEQHEHTSGQTSVPHAGYQAGFEHRRQVNRTVHHSSVGSPAFPFGQRAALENAPQVLLQSTQGMETSTSCHPGEVTPVGLPVFVGRPSQ
jgi:hypothetical protein